MEIQQIRYFLAVAELRNFTRAAERCHVAQPSLSQQIKKLEQEMGGPLFHRMGRKVSLTEQGKLLEEKAKIIYREHENAIHEVRDSFSHNNSVAFGAILTIAPYLIPALMADLDSSERAGLRIEENFTEALLEKVKRGRLDFAIMSSPVDEPDLLVEVLGTERFVAVLPPGHPLHEQAEVGLEQLLEQPFLELSHIHCAGKQLDELCGIGINQVRTVFMSSQIETIRRLVCGGTGVTVLPQMAVNDERELCIRPISGAPLEREITLVSHPDRYLSNAAKSLIERLKTFTQSYLNTAG